MEEELELLLTQFLAADNERRRRSEEGIRAMAKSPLIVPSLLHHVRSSHSPDVRQVAAVLLRKKIMGHWMKLHPQLRHSLKSALLESIALEHSFAVRRASANVVSVLAKHAVPAGEWPELLPFLFQCSHSVHEEHREMALIVFSSLMETIVESLKPHFATLVSIFMLMLQDRKSSRVRVAALKAVGVLAGCMDTDTDILKFRDLIPHILEVSRQCIADGNEDVAVLAFEIFDDLIESPAPILGPFVADIIHFGLEVCLNKTLGSNIRYQAIQIISWLAKYKPKMLLKHKVVGNILSAICLLLAEGDNGHDEDDVSLDQAAAEALDTIAMSLPKKHVFPSVFEICSRMFQSQYSGDRKAAVMSLGVISEGCFEIMKRRLTDVLSLTLLALQDNIQAVRGAACFSLGQFAEHLQPDIILHYEKVFPCIFNVLSDVSMEVQEKAYYALAAFCEDLGTEILPYLGPLMAKLLEALQSGQHKLQEISMSAIGSAAVAAGSNFIPYVERVLELVSKFMVLTKDEDLRSRARATELAGIIALAVGRDAIAPVLGTFIEAGITGFALDFSELREYTHGFFGHAAEVLGEDMAQYLPRIVPLALASCNLDDGMAVDVDVLDKQIAEGLGGVSSDDEGSDGVSRVRNFSVRTGIMDEKAAATQAVGLFALHTKHAIAPYLEEILKVVKKHAGYFHEDVRLQAIISLQHVLAATQTAFPSTNTIISPEVNHVFNTVMEIYLRAFREDDDKETVSQVCTCISEITKCFDYALLKPYIPQLCEAVTLLLKQEAICQQTGDAETEGDDDDEHDEILMDAVTDLIPALARCMGPDFLPVFQLQFGLLMKFAKPRRPPGDRTMVVACLAEVAQAIGPAITTYVDVVMPLVVKELASSEAANRRNAAFCIGELCKNGGETALKHFNDILFALYPLFGERESDNAVKDNAAGAIARMISTQPHALRLDQVLPIFIQVLPLKEDLEESLAVYNCLCDLILALNSHILPLIPQVIYIFAQVAASQKESAEVKTNVGRAVSHLLSQYKDQMQPILSSLPAEVASALACVMTHG